MRDDKTQGFWGRLFFELTGLEGTPQNRSPLGSQCLDCLRNDTAEVKQSAWSLVKAM